MTAEEMDPAALAHLLTAMKEGRHCVATLDGERQQFSTDEVLAMTITALQSRSTPPIETPDSGRVLCERLRATRPRTFYTVTSRTSPPIESRCQAPINPDGPEAADAIVSLLSQIEALQARVAELGGRQRVSIVDQDGNEVGERFASIRELTTEEAFRDEAGTVWTVPTAWAYFAACRARDEAQNEASSLRNLGPDWFSWESDLKRASTRDARPISDEHLDRFRHAVADNHCKSTAAERSEVEYRVGRFACKYGRALLARLDAVEARVATQSLEIAPKDGTMLWLLVSYAGGYGGEDDPDHPLADASTAWTIGFNNLEADGEDQWKFAGWCWSHDHFTEGRGKVLAWKPIGFELGADDDPEAASWLQQAKGEGL